MSERNQQLQSDRYSLLDCERRPVNENDKWCYQSDIFPWGEVVTIPFVPAQNMVLKDVGGHIIRSKKHRGNLLLQVVKTDLAPKYGVKSFRRLDSVASILNIRNFDKSEGKW